jgi:hypothetical protein
LDLQDQNGILYENKLASKKIALALLNNNYKLAMMKSKVTNLNSSFPSLGQKLEKIISWCNPEQVEEEHVGHRNQTNRSQGVGQ